MCRMSCGMMTVSDIVEHLGRSLLVERLGVVRQAISNACSDNRFPAKWYAVIHDLCVERGIECPRELFAFVTPAPTQEAAE